MSLSVSFAMRRFAVRCSRTARNPIYVIYIPVVEKSHFAMQIIRAVSSYRQYQEIN